MAVLKQRVYSNPMFINSLISEDGTVAAIILDFKGGAGDWWQKKAEVRSKKQEVVAQFIGQIDRPDNEGLAWAEEDGKKWQGGKGGSDPQKSEEKPPAEGQEGKWPAGGEGGWSGAQGGEKGLEQWYVSDSTIHKKVLEIVDKYKDANTEIYVGGLPIALSFLEADSWRMSRYIYPLALFIIMFVLYFAFRSIQGMILPIVCALLSVVWAVGLMGVLKIPLDPWNRMTPILILAVAAGHSVQILKRYYEELETAGKSATVAAGFSLRPEAIGGESHWGAEISRQSVVESLTKIGPVMITAGVVAAASFASLLTFKLKTFQSFGLFTAFGILSALILEMTFIPAARSLMRPPKKGAGKSGDVARGLLDRFLLGISRLVTQRSWLVWLGLVVGIAISFYGINKLTIINSLKGLFFESTQFRKDDAALN